MSKNMLFFGDNLNVLHQHIADESIDLVYLDPPFKSNQNYNVLFAERDGSHSAAQIKAFEDTWQWDQKAASTFYEVVESGGKVSQAMQAFRSLLGESDMLAYLAMMAPRIVKLWRVLKETGSIYLHCDSTASHYLKLLMDSIFQPENFCNEITWKRSHAHSDSRQGARHFGRVTDTLLFYRKTEDNTWHTQHVPYDKKYVERDYRRVDQDGRLYRIDNIQGPGGAAKGNPSYEVMGVTRYWRYSQEKMQELIRQGRIIQTKPGAVPQYKRYLDEMPGVPVQNLWADLTLLNNRSGEYLGYPTQKPEPLLERIISASSNEGDTVLDPFCGCGTAIVAAQNLNRRWIGIDVTYLATNLIKSRLKDIFGDAIDKTYEVSGEPTSVPDAEALALQDRFDFQCWALGLVGARPAVGEQKKGRDKGIDGQLFFHDDRTRGQTKQIIFSVKSGGVLPRDLRDLRGVIDREGAQIGVLITLEEPTRPMRMEAASAGFYDSSWNHPDDRFQKIRYPRLQILTIEELLNGKGIDRPYHDGNVTFRKAPRAMAAKDQQGKLF